MRDLNRCHQCRSVLSRNARLLHLTQRTQPPQLPRTGNRIQSRQLQIVRSQPKPEARPLPSPPTSSLTRTMMSSCPAALKLLGGSDSPLTTSTCSPASAASTCSTVAACANLHQHRHHIAMKHRRLHHLQSQRWQHPT